MTAQKVFNNALILECIFGFSNFEEIKCFRLVSRLWNAVAIPILKESALISFSKPDYTLQHFNQLFQGSQLGTDFNAVRISRNPFGFKWEISEFIQVLGDHKVNMTELIVDTLELEGYECSRRNIRPGFEITPHIEANLTKLHISDSCRMIISIDSCVSVKFLSLIGIGLTLKLTSGIKINPVELTLSGINVLQNGNLEASSLNGFVNFEKLKSLSLKFVWYTDDEGISHTLSFHLRDPVTVERLVLDGEWLHLDFKNAKWKVTEKFVLNGKDFLESNEMGISSFRSNHRVNLAVLPRNLKKFKIEDRVSNLWSSESVSLPELEKLHILQNPIFTGGGISKINCISHFNNCCNLTTLKLTVINIDNSCHYSVDITTLPKSVRKLYICGNIEFCGDPGSFELKQLSIKWCFQHFLYIILQTFKSENLAVDLRYPPYSNSVFETVMNISQRPFDNIVVALKGKKQENNYKSSPLSEITNELSGFYNFANGFGTSISKSKFEENFKF